MRGDRRIVLTAVRERGNAFKYASDELRRDRRIVFAAVRLSGTALEYASDKLKGDRRIVFAAVRQCGTALEYASDKLRGDRRIVLTAVRQCGHVLWCASDDLKRDKEVVFVALASDPSCIEYVQPVLRRSMDATALLAYLKDEIISTLPERYKVGAGELLETKAHISSEIPFVLQDESLSDVFKMEWSQRTLTPVDVVVYRCNLSKLLAMKVILQLCDGDIHSERFAQLCTRENIDSLSRSIENGLGGLGVKALRSVFCRIERLVGVYVAPLAANGPAAAPPSAAAPPLTRLVHDRLATAAHGEHEHSVVIPHIEFFEGFFESLMLVPNPQGVQHGPHM